MQATNEKSRDILNDLVDVCKDGQQGFQTAAKDVKDTELSATFARYAGQRTQFISELHQRIRLLGGDPDKHGSIRGTLHRGWMDLKTALSSNEPHAVLEECERGEDAAVKNYREALVRPELDVESRQLVQRQFEEVQAAHDRIRALRDSTTYAHR